MSGARAGGGATPPPQLSGGAPHVTSRAWPASRAAPHGESVGPPDMQPSVAGMLRNHRLHIKEGGERGR